MDHFPGRKKKKLYDELISKNIPSNLECFTYIEPFGGTFAVSKYLPKNPIRLIYNDINTYDFDIVADEILHIDYKEIIEQFDSEFSLFYLDPPYYGREFLYDLKTNDKLFHIELFESIKDMKGKFILSYRDVPFIRKLYSGYDIQDYKGNSISFMNEIIITNF